MTPQQKWGQQASLLLNLKIFSVMVLDFMASKQKQKLKIQQVPCEKMFMTK